MRQLRIIGMAAAIGLLILAGCESFFSESDTIDRATLLAQYGGFDMSDEDEGFGDPQLVSSYAEDPEYDDEMEDHPRVTNALRNGRAPVYMLRVVWGNIQRPDTTVDEESQECPVSDWSGSLVAEGGVAVIRRLIRFEPSDYIVRPRTSPQSLEWVSHTKCCTDGLLLEIIDEEGIEEDGLESTNTVTITTPFYTTKLAFADLEDYREFVEFDQCNRISIVAHRADPIGCPRGFLEGGWIAETDSSGYFRGAWISRIGGIMGHLRGKYEIRDGRRVFHGKWITRSGRFAGLLRGTWQPAGNRPGPAGSFEGVWVDESLTVKGRLRGHYHVCPDCDAGFFHGRWKKNCR